MLEFFWDKIFNQYPRWTVLTIVVIFIVSVLLIVMLLLFAKKPLPQLIIDDCYIRNYPVATLDIKVHNPGWEYIGVNRIIFKVMDCKVGATEVGKQEISDSANIKINADVGAGDVLDAPIAITIPAHEHDRATVIVSWIGPGPSASRYYIIVPALQTTNGFVRGKAFKLAIQQQSPTAGPATSENHQNVDEVLVKMDDANSAEIKWIDEVKHSKQITK